MDKYDIHSRLGRNVKRQFHIMAKPNGCCCNLGCTYCFYLSKEDLSSGPGTGRMSDEMLELFIEQYINKVTGPEVIFSWQGGEPTLLGLDFFRKVIALQRKYTKTDQRIENDLQTNGTLLNDEWCIFLKENRFLVGLSIDGPREFHDRYRVTKNNQPTYDQVFKAAKLLLKHSVPFNTLTCINRENAKRPKDIYRFLRREIGSTYIQFIPIVEYRGFKTTAPHRWDVATLSKDGSPQSRPGYPDSIVTDWSVDPYDWGDFLIKVFDEWYQKDLGKVLVNHCETLVAQDLGLPSQMCVYHEFCGKNLVVEHDGSVYSCDHFVYPEYFIGNIKTDDLDQFVFSRTQVKFGYSKGETLPSDCQRCPYLRYCWGECPKNRFLLTKEGEPGLNYLCRGLKKYFSHALPKVKKITAKLQSNPVQPKKRM